MTDQEFTTKRLASLMAEAGAKDSWPVPSDSNLSALVHYINICLNATEDTELIQISQKKSEEYNKFRKNINELFCALPERISGYQRAIDKAISEGRHPYRTQHQVDSLKCLYEAACEVRNYWTPVINKPTRSTAWHSAAKIIAQLAQAAWRTAGIAHAGVTNEDSPAVVLTRNLLDVIGYQNVTEEAIAGMHNRHKRKALTIRKK